VKGESELDTHKVAAAWIRTSNIATVKEITDQAPTLRRR
jgi:hypothetical protein